MTLSTETHEAPSPSVVSPDFVVQAALAHAPSPERGRVNFDRLLSVSDDPSELLRNLSDDPHTLETLIALLAGSQYLTEILLRNPGYMALLSQHSGLAQIKPAGWLRAEARNASDPWLTGGHGDSGAALDALRRYQQREMLRIGAADLAGLIELGSVTRQLSHLADSVIQTALEIVAGQLNVSPAGFVVVAMGKLGGRELNYSSDIDLLFLCQGNGDDQAEQRHKLAEHLIKALSEPTAEGFLYRVDMRLRPWGRVGPLTPTVAGYLRYLKEHARLWEKQALLRGRAAAGDVGLGNAFLNQVEPYLFGAGAEAIRREVHAMKQQTEAHLRQAGRIWGEVKLGEGSIRDAEFIVQYLQLAHGDRNEELRTGNTVEAMASLAERGLITPGEHRILAEGYTFLRTVEHYLQILEYRQTHTLPANIEDLRYLARRLGFAGANGAAEFVARYEQHTAAVRAVYVRHLAGVNEPDPKPFQRGAALTDENLDAGGIATMLEDEYAPSAAARQHMARLVPSYAATFDPIEIERHAVMAARLDLEHPVIVDAAPLENGQTRLTIVGYDFLGELSLICGLLFAYGFSIIDGYVYTYEPTSETHGQRKIVDVFTVQPVRATPGALVWHEYASDLLGLIRFLQQGQPRAAQGELAKRVAAALRLREPDPPPTLPPIDIEIDNEASDRYTVLQISAADTPGFLYEFTNALALSGVHIAQVFVMSTGNRVRDTLFVTDARGEKITTDARQRELRSASVLIKHFTHLLPRSPNPESALLHFHEYLSELFSRPSWPDELASLERPEVLDALARLLGVSEFLWDDFLRMQYENLFPVVADVESLGEAKSREALAAELDAVLQSPNWQDHLNEFKDREMFRIDMRHILGQVGYAGFSAELTDMTEVVLGAASERVRRGLASKHGIPQDPEGRPARFALAALGKCGGRELGFASDIELMFVFDGSGETTGPRVIPSSEFFEKLVVETTHAIHARREGIFQIDLQLRPYGKAGGLAVSLDAFRRYFAPAGSAWPYERQALVKLRPIAGDVELGRELEALRDRFLYRGAPFDVAAMRAMRERQLRHLVEAGRVNAKFSKGGLVDLEYIVQGLQITHGHRDPRLRTTNTGEAIRALSQLGFISAENAARLDEALIFLQKLINALRMVRGNNKDLTVPPTQSEEFSFLARRLGYGHDSARLSIALGEHMGWVQRLEGRLLSA